MFTTGQMDHLANLTTNTICNLRFHLEDHGMVADWNFFATAHGKGENDGAGRDVKNGVWRKVLQKKAFVSDLNDFVNVAKEKFKTFNIFGYSKDEVRSGEEFLKQRYKKPFQVNFWYW